MQDILHSDTEISRAFGCWVVHRAEADVNALFKVMGFCLQHINKGVGSYNQKLS